MNIKHTPEPWKIDKENVHVGCIATLHGDIPNNAWFEIWSENWYDGINAEANARRIVACVNSCSGIPTEALESGEARSVRDELADIYDLEQRVDKLLAALKDLAGAFEQETGFIALNNARTLINELKG